MATTTNDRAKKVNGRRCERIEKKGFDELMEEEKGTESETEESFIKKGCVQNIWKNSQHSQD